MQNRDLDSNMETIDHRIVPVAILTLAIDRYHKNSIRE